MKYLILLLLLLASLSPVFAQGILTYVLIGAGVLLVIVIIIVVVIFLHKGKGKKVKMSSRAANFTRIMSIITKESGIDDKKILYLIKNITRDYIDNPNADIADFLYKSDDALKNYFTARGLNEFDASILLNIIRTHADELLNI